MSNDSSRKNPLGMISLIGAAGGFAGMETLRHMHVIGPSGGWTVLQSGFEAGMVGGIADWFAVSALFRPIPSRRFAFPHTNIIVRSRAKLSAGIVDMVQNRWLSPETLAEHLGRLSASRYLLEHLSSPAARTGILNAARDLLGRFTGSLDAPGIAAFLDRALRDQLETLDLGPALGSWLEARIQCGDAEALWDLLAGSLAKSAEAGDFKAPIRQILDTAVTHYKASGTMAWLKGAAAELLFDYNDVSVSLSLAFAQSLREIQENREHPLRCALNEQLLGFAQGLTSGDPQACATLAQLQKSLADNAELRPFLAQILSRLQETLREQFEATDSPLSDILERLLEKLMDELRTEPETQIRIDAWVRRGILDIASRHHHLIGEMVASSLDPSKLPDEDLVAQIEEKVGADLQWIRVNGAVIGAGVGMALAILKILVAR